MGGAAGTIVSAGGCGEPDEAVAHQSASPFSLAEWGGDLRRLRGDRTIRSGHSRDGNVVGVVADYRVQRGALANRSKPAEPGGARTLGPYGRSCCHIE